MAGVYADMSLLSKWVYLDRTANLHSVHTTYDMLAYRHRCRVCRAERALQEAPRPRTRLVVAVVIGVS